LESEPGAEFSYPYLFEAKEGRIHLVYTWKRKSIKHATFNVSWLDAQSRAEGPVDGSRIAYALIGSSTVDASLSSNRRDMVVEPNFQCE
jgi:hypothetical protein